MQFTALITSVVTGKSLHSFTDKHVLMDNTVITDCHKSGVPTKARAPSAVTATNINVNAVVTHACLPVSVVKV